jgi:tetratricopeptide (TPR) repeat protein
MDLSWEQQLDELLVQANRLRIEKDLTGAARLLDAAADVVKAFGAWRFVRGSVAFEAGDLKLAIKELDLAIQRDPKVPEYRANLAAALIEKGREGDHFALRRARQLLDDACKADPGSAQAHANFGRARLALNENEGALACFDRALKLQPNHLPALFSRAATLKKLGRPKEALAAIDKLLKLDPKFEAAVEAKKRLQAIKT